MSADQQPDEIIILAIMGVTCLAMLAFLAWF